MVSTVFEPDYFEDVGMRDVFTKIKSHLEEYDSLPAKDIVIASVPKDKRENIKNLILEAESTDFSVSKDYDWLKKQTNIYLKERAIKQSILQSVDIIDRGGDYNEIKAMVEHALCKDIEIDLGLDYFGQLADRLKRIFTATDNRIKTYYPTLDELFNGGYPPYTLNMMIAKIHGHKCVSANTLVYLRDNVTGDVKNIKIGDFYRYIYKDVFIGGLEMPSLEQFQNKYGEVEGQKRYDSWIEKLRNKKPSPSTKSMSKLELFQNKYGKVEGRERYDSWIQKNVSNGKNGKGRETLSWYISKYGEVEGQERYDERQKKWMYTMNSKSPEDIEDIIRRRISNGRYNRFSKISQDLFFILYNEIKDDFFDVRFAMLGSNGDIDDSGFNNEKFLSHEDRNMFIDFYIGDIMKVIEFDGDYWHGESRGNKTLDEERDRLLMDNGYDVFHIRERDYNNDCDYMIKTCLDFIYG